MSIRFMPKKTTTAGKVPTTSDLIDGELGVNVTDKKIYMRVGAAIVEIFKSLTSADVGLDKVDNTSDVSKSVLSASKLTTARSIAITGGATGTATTFDGSANISIPVTGLNASNLNAGTIPVARSWALTGDVTSPAGSAATTLANSGVTAASYGPTANATLTYGGTFAVPQVTLDAKGRATAAATRTFTMPAAPTTVSGNAGTATTLQTARSINGTSFNGSADITTANWGTARTMTIGNTGKSVNGSTNYSWTLAEIGAQAALGYTPVNKAGDTMTGPLGLSGVAGTFRQVVFKTGNDYRWALNADSAAESGSNQGSNLTLDRFSDAGDWIGNVLAVVRSTGEAWFTNALRANGNRLIESDGGDIVRIRKLTAASYAALGTKDANTLYVIVG